ALNSPVAMHNRVMLENGRGTSKSLAEAKLWYERAAALGHAPALNDLGSLYLAGAGVPKNYQFLSRQNGRPTYRRTSFWSCRTLPAICSPTRTLPFLCVNTASGEFAPATPFQSIPVPRRP